jgi:uncharacterized peroxidase-related enzyme
MAWIETVAPEDATGTLARIYKAARNRAGRVFNVVRLQSPRPHVLRASMQLYQQIMFSPESGLSRAEREMIAVTVSRTNGCFY